MHLMQNKREKFNQSAIVTGASRALDDIGSNQAAAIMTQASNTAG